MTHVHRPLLIYRLGKDGRLSWPLSDWLRTETVSHSALRVTGSGEGRSLNRKKKHYIILPPEVFYDDSVCQISCHFSELEP